MTTCKCWATALVGLLLLPGVAASADPATEAYEKGLSLIAKQDYDAAIRAFTEAIRLNPELAGAYTNRGVAHDEKGEYDKAIADYTEAIRLNPELFQAYNNRGNTYGHKGDFDRAIADYTEAMRLNPNDGEAYFNRGVAYSKKGDSDKAIADFTEAIRLNPMDVGAYNNRGNAYQHKGKYDEAITDFTEAIRLNPKHAAFHNNLGWFLATCPEERLRDGKRAIDHATQACELTKWKEWGNLDTLAAAHAEAGQFDKAVEFQLKAVELAPKDAEKDKLRERLRIYRDGKPYRQPVKEK